MDIVWFYLLSVNVIGLFAMGLDKTKAKVNAWRIPEKTLIGIALAGGGLGVWIGMELFRHKTKHWYFKYGVPVIFLIELVVMVYLLG